MKFDCGCYKQNHDKGFCRDPVLYIPLTNLYKEELQDLFKFVKKEKPEWLEEIE
jgi:hypothetical protein